MAPSGLPGASSFQLSSTTMMSSLTDAQLRAAVSSLSSAAAAATPYSSTSRTGLFEPKQYTAPPFDSKKWQTPATPTPKTTGTARQRRSAAARLTPAPSTPTPVPNYAQAQQATMPRPAAATLQSSAAQVVARSPLPTTPQALTTSYPSRLRTGATLLMQPILASTSSGNLGTGRTGTRRGGIINYAEPDSGDEAVEPDAGERDRESDDSDFVASGGLRTSLRTSRARIGQSGFYQYSYRGGSPAPGSGVGAQGKVELDQSYLGMEPPARFIKPKRADPTRHEYPSQEALENQALKPVALVPVRVEFETETHRIRDCFMWDLNDDLVKPEIFARIFCQDLDLPAATWSETIANQIRAQVEEYEGLATMDLGSSVHGYEEADPDSMDMDVPECRVILSIDVQIATYHLMDHVEWDLLSPLTPEAFARQLCADIGLTGEALPLIAHALHEEILKHKKDAIEWGVIGGDTTTTKDAHAHGDETSVVTEKDKREKSQLKDKTGLGLGPGSWGRPPRDGLGRGPRALKSVWKDWNDAEEYATRFEVLTAEEVERREIERERASRRLRRETSKFQFSSRRRR
ncbi:SFH1 [Sanghuangporus weigelae]